jgi:ribosomal RNA assembly protein
MYEYRLLIPKKRVGVLIGDKGKMKRLIENKTSTSIEVYEEEVLIKAEDSYNAWICQQVVKAVGRGFNPRDALRLLKEGYVFEIIDIMDYARNQKDKFRLKGRVIGEDGKTRKHIERTTNTKIIVFGKTIGVIGPSQGVQDALNAIEMLLEGSQTGTVYKFLEKKAKMRIKKELI